MNSTPSKNLSARRVKRRSSVMINSPNDSSMFCRSSFLNGSSLVATPDTSISKLKKQNLTKELLRKQNLYKNRKMKRAELIEKNRNLIDISDEKDLKELDENYYSNFNKRDYEQCDVNKNESESKIPKLEIKEEKIEIKEEKIEHNDFVPNVSRKENKKANNTSNSIGSSILSRIASLKNTFKNMVNYGQSSNANTKPFQQQQVPPKPHSTNFAKPKLNHQNSSNAISKKSTSNLQNNNIKKYDPMVRSSSTSNIKQGSTRNNSNHKLAVLNQSNVNKQTSQLNPKLPALKKQDSTSSCRHFKSSSALAGSTSSLRSQCTFRSTKENSNNESQNKPIFKITKIKYDDRYLFDTVNNSNNNSTNRF